MYHQRYFSDYSEAYKFYADIFMTKDPDRKNPTLVGNYTEGNLYGFLVVWEVKEKTQ